MQTFLIWSENQEFIDAEINRLIVSLNVSPFDIIQVYPENSIGITAVRSLLKESRSTTFKSINRLIVINQIDKATTEAQNALLKFLEESRPSTTIALTSLTGKNILPTVLSRSQIIREKKSFSKKIISQEFYNSLIKLLSDSHSQRLNFVVSHIAKKEDALLFISNLTDLLEAEILTPTGKFPLNRNQLSKLLKKVSAVERYLDLNVNFKLVLDVLLLGFPGLTGS